MRDNSQAYAIVHFGDMVQNINERILPEDAEGLPYVGLEHLDPESLKIRRWGTPGEVEAQKLRFYTGDIIFGKRRYYQKKLAVADFDGICSAHAMVLRARSNVVLPEFLPFFMQSEMFFERAMSISVGSLSPTINWSTLAKQQFPLPPLDEQRRIAEILWAVEDTIEAYTLAFDQLQQSKHITLSELFSDPRQISTEYRVIALKEVCEMQEGRVFPSKDYSEAGIKLLRPGNLAPNGYLDWNENATRFLPEEYLENYPDYLVSPDDIVINLTAQSLEDGFMGRVCKAGPEDYCLLNQRLGRFIAKDGLHLDFLFRYLQTLYFRRHAESHCEGSKIKHLYWRHLQNFCIELPPLMIQEKKIQIAQEMDNAVSRLHAHIENLAKLRISLRENMLAGIALENYV